MAKTLTDLTVRNAKPGKVRREIADGGCRGLYLVVQPNGSRTWALRYRHAGKTRKLTIGPVYLGKDEIEQPMLDCANTLAGARKLAGEAALLLAAGELTTLALKLGASMPQTIAALIDIGVEQKLLRMSADEKRAVLAEREARHDNAKRRRRKPKPANDNAKQAESAA